MSKQKPKINLIIYFVYQAALILAAGLVVVLNGQAWGTLLLSQDPAILAILFLSAIAVEARPVRWTATRNTTLLPLVLLLTLMLVDDPALVIVVSGAGAFIGYGLLCEFPAHIRQTPGRAIQRVLFYTAQSIVVAMVISALRSLLPDSVFTTVVPNAFISNALVNAGLVGGYIVLSIGLVGAYNRFVSFLWPGDVPLPAPHLLIFLLTANAPLITVWFYQIAIDGKYQLVELMGEEGVVLLAIFFVWPVALLFWYFASSWLGRSVEGEEAEAGYDQFFRYGEKMLDITEVTELVVEEMIAEFRSDGCIVYSWRDKKTDQSDEKTERYELEGGRIGDQWFLRTPAEAIPDAGWPEKVEPETRLGEIVERGELYTLQGGEARDFLRHIGDSYSQYTAVMIIPLRYEEETSSLVIKVGFIVLIKRRGKFSANEHQKAAEYLKGQKPIHFSLRQARLFNDVQQFFVEINAAVSKSGKVLAATRDLFDNGINPAKFIERVGRGVQDYALIRVVEKISQGHSPGETDEILDGEGIKTLYAQIKQDDPNLPELTPDITNDIRTVISSLSLSFAIPYRWPTPEYGGIPQETQDLYEFFLRALKCNAIEKILVFGSDLNEQVDLDYLARDFPDVLKELQSLQEIMEPVELSQDAKLDNQTKAIHLSKAFQMLSPANGKQVQSSEQVILAQIRNSWANVIYNKREELLGWSDLTMKLETHTFTLTAEGIVVDLRVGNRGKSTATDIVVRMVDNDEYEILDSTESASRQVKKLEPDDSRRLSFRIRPSREDVVRVTFEVEWNDRRSTGRTMPFADTLVLQAGARVFAHIENPYIPGPPLRPGTGSFVGREDVFEFVRNKIGGGKQHNVLILTGQRRTGKTSLALQMPKRLDQERYVVAYIDGQALGTEPGTGFFLRDMSWMICEGLEDYGIGCEPLSLEDSGRSVTERFEQEFLSRVFRAIGERSLVLIFDEFEELEDRVNTDKLDALIFKYLRHLMQHIPNLAFIFVGSHRLQELTQDYWSIFYDFALHRKIGFLNEDAARQLITKSTKQDIFDPYAVDEIFQLTAGHPYLLQSFCHYMVDFRNRSRLQTINAQHVRDAIPEVLVQAEGHLVHLWRTASPMSQMVMASASRLLVGQESVKANDLVKQLEAYRVTLNPYEVLSAEEALARQEIFDRLSGDPPRYVFKVELVRQWIERNQPLSLVVGALTLRRRQHHGTEPVL